MFIITPFRHNSLTFSVDSHFSAQWIVRFRFASAVKNVCLQLPLCFCFRFAAEHLRFPSDSDRLSLSLALLGSGRLQISRRLFILGRSTEMIQALFPLLSRRLFLHPPFAVFCKLNISHNFCLLIPFCKFIFFFCKKYCK